MCDVVLQARANRVLGIAYQARGDYRRAIDCFGQTVAFFEGVRRHEHFTGVVLPAVHSRAWLAVCHAEPGTFAEGTALGEEGLRIAEAVAHPGSLIFASWGLGLLAIRHGDLPSALPVLERAVGLCQVRIAWSGIPRRLRPWERPTLSMGAPPTPWGCSRKRWSRSLRWKE